MSQQMVGIVIDRLLDDEELRVRFVRDRIETLGALSFLGIELTRAEMDVFIQTDARLWFWGSGMLGERTH
jgi:hypothetical protein